MTFLRSKSFGEEMFGKAERAIGSVTGSRKHQALGTAREYAGRAGSLTSEALAEAGRHVRRRPLGIVIGAGLGLGAIAAAWLIARHHARVRPEEDEHDPMRQVPVDAGNAALDESDEDRPKAGKVRYY